MPPAALTSPSLWRPQLLSELSEDLTRYKVGLASSLQSAPGAVELAHTDLQMIIDACTALQEGNISEDWSITLLQVMNSSHARMRDAPSASSLTVWRSIYTDACIVRALSQSVVSDHLQAISTLDHAIIIAGPCGEGRLSLVLDLIERFQALVPPYIAAVPPVATTTHAHPISDAPCTVPSLKPPSLLAFQKTYSLAPFILRNYASEWPAVSKWKSASYLRSVSGPGRVVPVEIGRDYRLGDWKQELMSWDTLLSALEFEDQSASGSTTDLYYLAQHDLTKQFPNLRDDIVLPDYLYSSLSTASYPGYRPPSNDDQVILNTWLGPQNTMSPAHFDPYYNLYGKPSYFKSHLRCNLYPTVQVVGQKTVWLAPPSVSEHMQAPDPSKSHADADASHFPSSSLSNTSGIDVFAAEQSNADFVTNVEPVSMTAVLSPGDMLFFPPGWWHAMKSESTSFSLSMWF